MWSRLSIVAVVAASAAVPAPAQERQPAPEAHRRVFVWQSPDLDSFHSDLARFFNRRARLGLTVNLRARATDSIGAYVNGVTPGGPAAKAGIKSGDIITRLDGKSLLGGNPDADKNQSAPGLRLIEMAARLEPNDTVAVEFRRDQTRKTVAVITSDEPSLARGEDGEGFSYSFSDGNPEDGPPPRPRDFERMRVQGSLPEKMRMPGADGPMMFAMDAALEDLELAPVNPDLGRYFGTSDGILVINVPEDSRLNLKAGDVVLSVDGRAPTTPAHLLRILRSYEPGEEFKLEIMRMKKKETVTGHIGQRGRGDGD